MELDPKARYGGVVGNLILVAIVGVVVGVLALFGADPDFQTTRGWVAVSIAVLGGGTLLWMNIRDRRR